MNHEEEKKDMTEIIEGVTSGDKVLRALADTDDDNISGGNNTIVVINLNYVWDAANTKWVRMTQP